MYILMLPTSGVCRKITPDRIQSRLRLLEFERLGVVIGQRGHKACAQATSSENGSSALPRRCTRYVRFPPITAEKADIPVGGGPLINCGTKRTSRHSTLVLVQSCSVPKVIEFFLDPPSELPPAGSKLVETLEVGGALGRR